MRSDLEFQRVHEFLSPLHSEFEPRRAHLLARGRVPISEVLAELRAEETRLRSTGLLAVPSVLAVRTLVSSARLPSFITIAFFGKEPYLKILPKYKVTQS